MTTDRILRAAFCVLLFATLPACENPDDPSGPGDQGLGALEETMESLIASLEPVSATLEFLPEPVAAIRADGAQIGVLDARGASDVALDVSFPPDVAGSTYVRNPSTHSFERDPERGDAPSDGVRVVQYRRLESGGLVIPLQESAFIDLRDEDFGSTERLGITLVSLEEAESDEFLLGGEQDDFTRVREIEGTLSGDSQEVSVAIVSAETGLGTGFRSSYFDAELRAGPSFVRVTWSREMDTESGQGEGSFHLALQAGDAFLFTDGRMAGSDGGEDEIEGEMSATGVDASIEVSGTFQNPSLSTEGELGTAEREALRRILQRFAEFVEEWRTSAS